MRENQTKLKKITINIFILISLILLIFFDFRTSIEISLFLTTITIVLIEKWLWKPILLFCHRHVMLWKLVEDYETPILREEYQCVLNYEYAGKRQQKEAILKVEQTYTSIDVMLHTNEVKSNAVISEIKKENNEFVLYYIYSTKPKMAVHDKNPPQLGGCRINLHSLKDSNSNISLNGIYWTTSKSIGDMELF